MSLRVAGLDLSLTSTGVASTGGLTRTIRPRTTGDRRLVEIAFEAKVATVGADLVVIENFVTRSPSASLTGMVHGAVRTALMEHGRRYVLVPPAVLKKYATGNGAATKADMAVALFKRAGIELPTDDEVDAWWLRAAGLQLLGEPVVQLPAAQVAALDKIPMGDPR